MMKKLLLYVHGKNGSADEAEHYKKLFTGYDVVGIDYQASTPWEAKEEFLTALQKFSDYDDISVLANSIGAYFVMHALSATNIKRAFFISPIVDMEKLISDMMLWAGIDEARLQKQKEVSTSFGETLSWDYLCYVRNNPIIWNIPTDILYGQNDNLTSYETISAFAEHHQATLIVMNNGEHWFHTDEQIKFLDCWLKNILNAQNK